MPREIIIVCCILAVLVIAWTMWDVNRTKVNIGTNPQISKEKRHGVAWVVSENGGTVQQPFIVDKPQHLVNPKNHVVKDLFAQLKQMGYFPVRLEIINADTTRTYKESARNPFTIHRKPA